MKIYVIQIGKCTFEKSINMKNMVLSFLQEATAGSEGGSAKEKQREKFFYL